MMHTWSNDIPPCVECVERYWSYITRLVLTFESLNAYKAYRSSSLMLIHNVSKMPLSRALAQYSLKAWYTISLRQSVYPYVQNPVTTLKIQFVESRCMAMRKSAVVLTGMNVWRGKTRLFKLQFSGGYDIIIRRHEWRWWRHPSH
jgi:hypothetical protein